MKEYERVVTEFCEVTGAQPWAEGDAAQMELGGAMVNLFHDAEGSPGLLNVYCDLGPSQTEGLHRHLLMQNVCVQPHPSAQFGLHPVSGNVVYRVRLPLAGLDGRGLPARVEQFVAHARGVLLN